MKLFKLFILPLFALPSVALGMESSMIGCSLPCKDAVDTAIYCEGARYDLSPVKFEEHRKNIKMYVDHGMLKKHHLEYILAPERVGKLIGFGDQVFPNGRKHICAIFTQSSPNRFVFWDNGIPMPSTPWYRHPTVWAATAAIVGLGASYLYRDSLAEMVQNPAPAISKAQSLWSGIKGVFAR